MGLWQFCVSTKTNEADTVGQQTAGMLADFGIRTIRTVRSARLFTIELEPGSGAEAERHATNRIANELLCDPVTEQCTVQRSGEQFQPPHGAIAVEVHYRPGVMDNVANSTLLALRDMGIDAWSVRTARRFELSPIPSVAQRRKIARLLGNECIEEVVFGFKPIEPPPLPPTGDMAVRQVAIRSLADTELQRLSREGHLFLSLEEMRAIQSHFAVAGRDPTDLELETLAQTWSEHCVHKTLTAAIEYAGAPFPNPQPPAPSPQPPVRRYDNLLKDTIARATRELIDERRGPTCLSVFTDNAGVIAFDGEYGIAFKVETHNHPSAIEPYGGAATGIGGVIRDVLGCGLGAKPIANTDVFCVAPPDWPVDGVPRGVIHPKLILKGIVAGVRDYGNRMGIPTVNGAVHFDPRYLGNPLVYCGCVGLIPRDRIEKAARPGDAIVLIGGRTGRDGIHGATFSSAELTDTHADEFAHAVQIGNAIEEKKILDVVLQARDYVVESEASGTEEKGIRGPGDQGIRGPGDQGSRGPGDQGSHGKRSIRNPKSEIRNKRCLYSAITDCGAGGLSSAVGEMGEAIGAEVDLEMVPLKYAGLRYDEIWISEAQERMVLAVPPENVEAMLHLARREDVEATVIGRFTDTRRLLVRYAGVEVGDLDMEFLHRGLPKTTRRAEWRADPRRHTAAPLGPTPQPPLPTSTRSPRAEPLADHPKPETPIPKSLLEELKRRLSDPTIASKHWIVRQYDHEVQAGSVVKPLTGPRHGPSDAAVLRPRLDSNRGIAVGCGLAPQVAKLDPYWMAVAAIDEAVRNVVCVGGDPEQTAILDNFCWPRVDDPRSLGALVRACQACYDVAKTYGVPFISGKDSLNNEFALHEADAEMLRALFAKRWPRIDSSLFERDAGASQPPRKDRLAIPYTLLISALSVIDDVTRCVSMDLKQEQSQLYLIGRPTTFSPDDGSGRPLFDLALAARTHRTVARMIREGLVCAVHDVSDGGLLVACAEMSLAGGRACRVHVAQPPSAVDVARPPSAVSDQISRSPSLRGGGEDDERRFYFDPSPALYVVEVLNSRYADFVRVANALPSLLIASVGEEDSTARGREFAFEMPDERQPPAGLSLEELEAAWKAPLDW